MTLSFATQDLYPYSHTPYLPHPEIPYPGCLVFSSGVHELTVLVETNGSYILGNPLKHIHLEIDRLLSLVTR